MVSGAWLEELGCLLLMLGGSQGPIFHLWKVLGRHFRLLGSHFNAFGDPWEVMFGSWGLLLGVLGSLCGPKLRLVAILLDSGSHLGSILTGFEGF